jgi:tetratricopeptide (TPR) repeat protein
MMNNLSIPTTLSNNTESEHEELIPLEDVDQLADEKIIFAQDSGESLSLVSQLTPHLSLEIIRGPKTGQCFYINERRMLLGRSKDVELQLPSPNISRRQLEFHRREDGMFIKNLSSVTSVSVNNCIVDEARIFNGDEVAFATSRLLFQSNRPQDCWSYDGEIEECETLRLDSGARAVVAELLGSASKLTESSPELSSNNWKSSGWSGKSFIAIFALIALYFGYQQFVIPWQVNSTLQEVAFDVESGEYGKVSAVINTVLASNPDSGNRKQAQRLLAKATLIEGQNLQLRGELTHAVAFLDSYLRRNDIGSDNEAIHTLWDNLNLQLGDQYRKSGKLQDALGFYVSIHQESALYSKAQEAIDSMGFNHAMLDSDTGEVFTEVTELLQKAEPLFYAKSYLTPTNANAYTLYKRVLELDSGNTIALARIETMKTYYQRLGDLYVEQKSYQQAVTIYKRYLMIAPNSHDIQKKASAARRYAAWSKRLSSIRQQAGSNLKSSVAGGKAIVFASNTTDKGRKRVEEILQASDIKPGWISEYLYEDSKQQDAPW